MHFGFDFFRRSCSLIKKLPILNNLAILVLISINNELKNKCKFRFKSPKYPCVTYQNCDLLFAFLTYKILKGSFQIQLFLFCRSLEHSICVIKNQTVYMQRRGRHNDCYLKRCSAGYNKLFSKNVGEVYSLAAGERRGIWVFLTSQIVLRFLDA